MPDDATDDAAGIWAESSSAGVIVIAATGDGIDATTTAGTVTIATDDGIVASDFGDVNVYTAGNVTAIDLSTISVVNSGGIDPSGSGIHAVAAGSGSVVVQLLDGSASSSSDTTSAAAGGGVIVDTTGIVVDGTGSDRGIYAQTSNVGPTTNTDTTPQGSLIATTGGGGTVVIVHSHVIASDFDGDSRDDILWQKNTGEVAVWL